MTSSLPIIETDEIEPDVPDVDDFVPPDDESGDEDEDADNSGPWITIATFWEAPRMHLARLKLESEGIPCAVIDENIVAVDWGLAVAIGGIKLQVPQSRAADALAFLGITAAPPASEEPIFDGISLCPSCGSDRIHRPRFNRRLAFLSMLFLNLPIPFFNRKMCCQSCGFRW